MLQDQYIFIHDAILESVTCGDTQIEAGNLRRRLSQLQKKDDSGRTGFELQFSVSTQCGIYGYTIMCMYSHLSVCVYLTGMRGLC